MRVQFIKTPEGVVMLPFTDEEVEYIPTKRECKRKYSNLVKRLTDRNVCGFPNIEARGFKSGCHIDHIVPISYGFKHSINPHLIAARENLRLIPHKENLDKGTKLTEDSLLLLSKWEEKG